MHSGYIPWLLLSYNMKWVSHLCWFWNPWQCEKAESLFSTKIEFVLSDWRCISGQCGLSCSLFEILKCCADQSDTKSKNAGVWHSIVAMTAQEWRLCTRLGAERGFFLLFFPSVYFYCPPSYHPLPKAAKSSHLHKYNSAVLTEPDWVELWSHTSPPASFVYMSLQIPDCCAF